MIWQRLSSIVRATKHRHRLCLFCSCSCTCTFSSPARVVVLPLHAEVVVCLRTERLLLFVLNTGCRCGCAWLQRDPRVRWTWHWPKPAHASGHLLSSVLRVKAVRDGGRPLLYNRADDCARVERDSTVGRWVDGRDQGRIPCSSVRAHGGGDRRWGRCAHSNGALRRDGLLICPRSRA